MAADYKEHWSECFKTFKTSYPAEQLARIFKGTYPNKNFKNDYSDKKLLEMGCANGRNTVLLNSLGFKELVSADITQELVNLAMSNIKNTNPEVKLPKFIIALNNEIPSEDNYFDFLVSWGVSYYMTPKDNGFYTHLDNIKEYARVLKKDAFLIIDVPQYNGDVYDNAKEIQESYWMDSNGIILRRFKDMEDFKSDIEPYFYDIQTSTLTLDCFGKNYSRYTIIARKK